MSVKKEKSKMTLHFFLTWTYAHRGLTWRKSEKNMGQGWEQGIGEGFQKFFFRRCKVSLTVNIQ